MGKSKVNLQDIVKKFIPLLFLIIGLFYAWRPGNWFELIPAYGDILEIAWGTEWFLSNLSDLHSAFHYPLTYYPAGWDVRTFPVGLGVFLITVPLKALGGTAFALNVGGLLAIITAFGGVYFLLNRHVSTLSASISALLFAIWDFRYLAHYQILFGTALLPWFLFLVEKGCQAHKRKWIWFVTAGALWGLMASMTLYFIWLGAIAVFCWLFGHRLARNINWLDLLKALLIVSTGFFIVALPSIILFGQSNSTGTDFFDIYHLNLWSASLNSIFSPSPEHPLLRPISQAIYSGELGETGRNNVGLFAAIAVLAGFWRIPDKRRLAPIYLLATVGLILGLGPFLKWNNTPLNFAPLRGINEIVWGLAYNLKPVLFLAAIPRPEFAGTIFLPEFFFASVVPYWEGVRTVSRFILVGGLGFFLLVAFSIDHIKSRWVKYLIVALVILEVLSVPYSRNGVPLDTDIHAAYAWLQGQKMGDEAIIDLQPVSPRSVEMFQEASIIWAAQQHQKFNVSGTGSVWPEQALFLQNWLKEHQITEDSAESSAILGSYNIRYIFLYMKNEFAEKIVRDLNNSAEFSTVGCFEPPAKISPWREPICIIENLGLAPNHDKPLFYKNGWGGLESWGIWGTNEASRFDWIAAEKRDYELFFDAKPYCIADQWQEVEVFLNGEPLLSHQWTDCDSIQKSIMLPQEEIDIGWNNIIFKYGYAAQPIVVTSGKNSDERHLAVAFSEIIIK